MLKPCGFDPIKLQLPKQHIKPMSAVYTSHFNYKLDQLLQKLGRVHTSPADSKGWANCSKSMETLTISYSSGLSAKITDFPSSLAPFEGTMHRPVFPVLHIPAQLT